MREVICICNANSAKSGNYNISSGATQAWSITKKSLSITASSTNISVLKLYI